MKKSRFFLLLLFAGLFSEQCLCLSFNKLFSSCEKYLVSGSIKSEVDSLKNLPYSDLEKHFLELTNILEHINSGRYFDVNHITDTDFAKLTEVFVLIKPFNIKKLKGLLRNYLSQLSHEVSLRDDFKVDVEAATLKNGSRREFLKSQMNLIYSYFEDFDAYSFNSITHERYTRSLEVVLKDFFKELKVSLPSKEILRAVFQMCSFWESHAMDMNKEAWKFDDQITLTTTNMYFNPDRYEIEKLDLLYVQNILPLLLRIRLLAMSLWIEYYSDHEILPVQEFRKMARQKFHPFTPTRSQIFTYLEEIIYTKQFSITRFEKFTDEVEFDREESVRINPFQLQRRLLSKTYLFKEGIMGIHLNDIKRYKLLLASDDYRLEKAKKEIYYILSVHRLALVYSSFFE